eukprot:754044-Hanusia_phi.AAC.5
MLVHMGRSGSFSPSVPVAMEGGVRYGSDRTGKPACIRLTFALSDRKNPISSFVERPSIDSFLEIGLDPLRHDKPGAPKRRREVSIAAGSSSWLPRSLLPLDGPSLAMQGKDPWAKPTVRESSNEWYETPVQVAQTFVDCGIYAIPGNVDRAGGGEGARRRGGKRRQGGEEERGQEEVGRRMPSMHIRCCGRHRYRGQHGRRPRERGRGSAPILQHADQLRLRWEQGPEADTLFTSLQALRHSNERTAEISSLNCRCASCEEDQGRRGGGGDDVVASKPFCRRSLFDQSCDAQGMRVCVDNAAAPVPLSRFSLLRRRPVLHVEASRRRIKDDAAGEETSTHSYATPQSSSPAVEGSILGL